MKASDKASGKIEVQFTASGSYASRTENILLDVVCDYKAPYYVIAAGNTLPRILYREDFEKAEEGWYYSNRLHSALIRFRNPGTDAFTVEIATGRRDLIGMGWTIRHGCLPGKPVMCQTVKNTLYKAVP